MPSGYGDQARVVVEPDRTDHGPRCPKCGKKLAEFVSRPWSIMCSRCKARVQSAN